MAFPTGWTSLELQSDHTKVSGSANLTDFPALISSANIPSAVYAGLNQGEIYSSWLDGDTGIKAYYRGESGALTTDSSGNSKTLTNNNTVGEASGRFGGAFSLGTSNTNKSMTTTDQLGFTHGSVKVIIARVKCTGQPGTNVTTHPAYIVTGSAGNGHGFGISYRDSAGTKKVGVNTYGSAGSTTREIDMTLTTNQYYTFIVIDDQTNVYCYLDGVLIASGARVSGEGAGWTNYYGCSIGCRGGGSTRDNHFSGDVDDVVFMSRVPTATEIKYISHGGQDLRITTDSAGTTEIPFEIVSLDAVAETAEIWTKVPTLDYDGATSIYLWYGNASATPYAVNDTYGSDNVWKTEYKGVWHLQESSGTRIDSTSNSNDLTDNNTVLTGTGKIGTGADFEATNTEYLSKTDNASLDITGNMRITAWANIETESGNEPILAKDSPVTRAYNFFITGSAMNLIINGTSVGTSHGVTASGQLHKYTVEYTASAGSVACYVDGAIVATPTGLPTSINSSAVELRVGNDGYNSLFDGIIDEVHLHSGILGADWELTEYNNQNDPSTFWTAITESPSPSLSPSLSPSVSPSVSVSLSPSASASPSSSVSLSPSRSPSLSPSPSSSVSLSPSRSPSASASPSSSISLSPSLSESRSPSRSPSASVSPSSSASLSQSRSPSASASPSSSISLSPSSSSSKSPSPSASPSATPSPSPSRSPSLSPSPSSSVSLSPSVSESRSPSISVSPSPSLSESRSISLSPSPSSSVSLSPSLSESRSPSSSESPSPSAGYEDYTRGNYVVLPTDDADLETNFSSQDYIDVSTDDSVRVEQLGSSEYMVFQFRNFVSDSVSCQVHWNGQSDLPPNVSTVYLQIYNQNTNEWETVDSDSSSSVNTDFDLYADILDLTNYRDALNVITCRVYQGAT